MKVLRRCAENIAISLVIRLGLIKVLPYFTSFTLPKIGNNDLSQRNDKKSFLFILWKDLLYIYQTSALSFKKPLRGRTLANIYMLTMRNFFLHHLQI